MQTLEQTSSSAGEQERSGAGVLLRRLRQRLAKANVSAFDLELSDGSVHRLGEGPAAFQLRLLNSQAMRALGSFDQTAVAKAYVNGDISVSGSFLAAYDLRDVLSDRHPLHSLWTLLRPLLFGKVRTDKFWVPQHYDHGNDFYFAFLDRRTRLYSQALFASEQQSLEDAAESKLDYICRACCLSRGSQVLDVGAGWGSFARYAGARGANVTMLTISREQYGALKELCATNDLPGKLAVEYESIFAYAPQKQFDAVVLLGVMEHLPAYKRLFGAFERLLRPGGRIYMDFAAMRDKYRVGSFSYRYVFPGSHKPVNMAELFAAANRSIFEAIALHNDRHSYFLTLQHWARNLEAARDELLPKYGGRTYRLFQLYLWGCARQLQRDGELESYRVVWQKAHGGSSAEIGLVA